ncbi:F-box domain-containing protein [Mycena kentingensis (nom. inval.)]|nr:F-box domain-containing protein [Mycena kentingensis (nom. inval.)]
MSNDTALPDEILSEILCPALRIQDDTFTNASPGTFAQYSESTSAYLLVSKSWLRVATPLLYSVVVLRSKAQAQALADALTRTPALGRMIHKLRVEGGYGIFMHTILALAPNITDLFLFLEIWSPDTTDGLCKGLSLIDPSTLLIRDGREYGRKPKNKAVTSLVDSLAGAIARWKNLTSFTSPWRSDGNGKAVKIMDALASARRLKIVHVPSCFVAPLVYGRLKKCPLERISVDEPKNSFFVALDDPSFAALAHYRQRKPSAASGAEAANHTPSLNPFFVPLQNVPDQVKDAIWSRVLYFSMSCPEREDALASTYYYFYRRERFIDLLCVSKTFLRVGLPHYYSVLQLDYSETSQVQRGISQTSRLPIHTLISCPLPIHTVSAIVNRACETLVELRVSMENVKQPPPPQETACTFGRLQRLRRVRWEGPHPLGLGSKGDMSVDSLPRLEKLVLLHTPQSVVLQIAAMSLPSLRVLHISFPPKVAIESTTPRNMKTLYTAHGTKLVELALPIEIISILGGEIFALCPNIPKLILIGKDDVPPRADSLTSPVPHPTLTQIQFQVQWPHQKTKQKSSIKLWDTFFADVKRRENLPNLHTFHFLCMSWPTNEKDIAKSCWVRWAESIHELDIHLADREGRKWRPRLKLTGSGRKGG